jgi:hypothetical protein
MKTRQQLNATHISIPVEYKQKAAEAEYHRHVHEQWQRLLGDERDPEPLDGYWGRDSAIAELQELRLLSRIRDPQRSWDRRFARLLSREVSIYRHNYSAWPKINEEFRHLKRLLRAMLRKLKSFAAEISIFLIAELIERVELFLEKLPEQQRGYWEGALKFTPSELHMGFIPKRGRGIGQFEFAPSSADAISLEDEISKWRLPATNFTNRNIDTRFQVRLATLFWLFYPKLSWGCVCSLIVLVYIAGENTRLDEREKLRIHPLGAEESAFPLDAVMLETKLKKLAPAVPRPRASASGRGKVKAAK